METATVEPLVFESSAMELDPESRIARLREMYWDRTHEGKRLRKPVVGSGTDSLVGHAEDFAALLRVSDPVIQPGELIVGCALAEVEDKDSIDLGFYDRHYPPGHENILRKGLAGMRDEARERLSSETDPEKQDFYRAVEIAYNAACGYAASYADCAREAAASESDPTRQSELLGIAEVCDELAGAPPSSFQAALQLVQFSRLFGGSGCIGRFDQWMTPFLEADLESERLSPGEAQELLECLFIKLNYFGGTGQAANDSLRNIALAGQTSDGHDASNELSTMCLEASGKLMLPEPKLNVRFFDGSPPELLRACCRVLAKGANVLAVFNDEVVVPALLRLGIPIEDARDYCNDGCSEIILGGKGTIQFRVHDSLPLLTETVMEARERSFESFDQVMDDFKSRLDFYMPPDSGSNPPVTFPYFAASIDDCMEKGSASGARYPITGSILAQVGDTADGLAAIQQLIYHEGVLTWEDLASALDADFEGHEPLRQMIRNRGPKYGNDDDRV
ncbi:MAG: pyruvate formate lyase family protein, partial [Candidatus Latescibacteria bacterium]|nr:pyruvate formate lyase family protein [Candidatus Latescibacterota bacterium]